MATDATFVAFILDQLSGLPGVSARKMFGEYALYSETKVVALICENQLFVKPTDAGRKHLGTPIEAPPYPTAKPCFLIQDALDDREGLRKLISVTAQALPMPKAKKR